MESASPPALLKRSSSRSAEQRTLWPRTFQVWALDCTFAGRSRNSTAANSGRQVGAKDTGRRCILSFRTSRPSSRSPIVGDRRRVLIVEDDQQTSTVLGDTLRDEGYDVRQAT